MTPTTVSSFYDLCFSHRKEGACRTEGTQWCSPPSRTAPPAAPFGNTRCRGYRFRRRRRVEAGTCSLVATAAVGTPFHGCSRLVRARRALGPADSSLSRAKRVAVTCSTKRRPRRPQLVVVAERAAPRLQFAPGPSLPSWISMRCSTRHHPQRKTTGTAVPAPHRTCDGGGPSTAVCGGGHGGHGGPLLVGDGMRMVPPPCSVRRKYCCRSHHFRDTSRTLVWNCC